MYSRWRRRLAVEPPTFDENDFLIAFWITLPIALRLVLLAIIGVLLGAVANDAIYRFAWDSRPIGPWGNPGSEAPPRRSGDRIPILGWFGLRRESEIHGKGFWVRPMLIELAMGIGVPCYYWYLTQTGATLPMAVRNAAGIAANQPWMTIVFGSHLIMISLMVAATFIDFDEQTIPDALTVPGTLIALVLSCLSLQVFLPAIDTAGALVPITFQLPAPAPVRGSPWMGPTGWWTGIAIWTGWCFALANRRVILPPRCREGFGVFLRITVA